MKRLLISAIAVLSLSQCNCGFSPVDPSKSGFDGGSAAGGGNGATGGGASGGGTANQPDGGFQEPDSGIDASCAALTDQYQTALTLAKACVLPNAGQPEPCSALVQSSITCGCQTYVEASKGAALELARMQLENTFRAKRCSFACPLCRDVQRGVCKATSTAGQSACADE